MAACGRPAAVEQNQTAMLAEFWVAFRSAVAAGNPEGIAALADFPFQTRGPSDSDPVVPRDRAAFLQLVGQMLETDSGMKPEPEPMRALIARTPELRPSSAGGNSARVGSFVFRQVQGRWRFTMAYLDE
jgi:hypothetical protein